MPSAESRIATDRASRYLAQLCEHLNQLGHQQDGHQQGGHKPRRHAGMRSGRRPDVPRIDWNDTHAVIEFVDGSCELTADSDGLTIQLTADEPEALQHLQDMFTARIQTIGRRDRLIVNW